MDQSNPSIIFMLARYYYSQTDYENSITQYEKLIDLGCIKTDAENIGFSKTIYNGYFLSLLYAKKADVVLEKTRTWKEQGPFTPLIGVYRATAWKRTAETYSQDDNIKIEKALNSALKIFDDIFRNYGYFEEATKQATKIFEEVIFYYNNPYSDKEKISDFLNIIYKHFIHISEIYINYDWVDLLEKFMAFDINNNPFNNQKTFNENKLSIQKMYSDGTNVGEYKYIRITSKRDSTLFAQDYQNTSYFLHINQYKGPKNWYVLKNNDIIKVLASTINNPAHNSIKILTAYST